MRADPSHHYGAGLVRDQHLEPVALALDIKITIFPAKKLADAY